MDNVTNKNALSYAMNAYDNPQCLTETEFHEDYKRFRYIKRLCRQYVTTQKVSERLLINHLILLTNVFGIDATVRLLFLKCDDERSWRVLKPCLWYLSMLPEVVRGVNGKNIYTDRIPLDEKLLRKLRQEL